MLPPDHLLNVSKFLQLILYEVLFTHHLRRTFNPSSQHSAAHYANSSAFQHCGLYKSATTSRAWPRPLRGAFLIPPPLLVVADLILGFPEKSQVISAAVFGQEKIKNRRPWKRPTVSAFAI